jgi:hypothetical protein
MRHLRVGGVPTSPFGAALALPEVAGGRFNQLNALTVGVTKAANTTNLLGFVARQFGVLIPRNVARLRTSQ